MSGSHSRRKGARTELDITYALQRHGIPADSESIGHGRNISHQQAARSRSGGQKIRASVVSCSTSLPRDVVMQAKARQSTPCQLTRYR
jgi:hypothetical protein